MVDRIRPQQPERDLTPQERREGAELRDALGGEIARLMRKGYSIEDIREVFKNSIQNLERVAPTPRFDPYKTIETSEGVQREIKAVLAKHDLEKEQQHISSYLKSISFDMVDIHQKGVEDFDGHPKNTTEGLKRVQYYQKMRVPVCTYTKADLERLVSENKLGKRVLDEFDGMIEDAHIITADGFMIGLVLGTQKTFVVERRKKFSKN